MLLRVQWDNVVDCTLQALEGLTVSLCSLPLRDEKFRKALWQWLSGSPGLRDPTLDVLVDEAQAHTVESSILCRVSFRASPPALAWESFTCLSLCTTGLPKNHLWTAYCLLQEGDGWVAWASSALDKRNKQSLPLMLLCMSLLGFGQPRLGPTLRKELRKPVFSAMG